MLLPLEPLVDVALDPVVDVPVEPTTGALGAAGALLGVVLPVEVLGGLPAPNGAILGTPVGSDGRMPSQRPPASPGGSLLARHSLMNLLFCWPIRSISIASRSHRSFFVASALFSSAAKAVSPDKLKAAHATKRADAKTIDFVMMELCRAAPTSNGQQTNALSGFQSSSVGTRQISGDPQPSLLLPTVPLWVICIGNAKHFGQIISALHIYNHERLEVFKVSILI
jgi:hypothetical protein